MNLTFQTTNANNRNLLQRTDGTLDARLLVSAHIPITITGGAGAIPGVYYGIETPPYTANGIYLDRDCVNATGAAVTNITATIPDNYVKVTSRVEKFDITTDGKIQCVCPNFSGAVGTPRARISLRLSPLLGAVPAAGPWVDNPTPGQTLSMTLPPEFLNTTATDPDNFPFACVEIKDDVADWQGIGWIMSGNGYVEASVGYYWQGLIPFCAPQQNYPTDAQIAAILPASHLANDHVTIVPIGDSITVYNFPGQQAYLNAKYPGKFTLIDSGMSGSLSPNWLPDANDVHRNSTSNENFFNYVAHQIQAALSANPKEVVIVPFFLGTNGGNLDQDTLIINTLKSMFPSVYLLVRPVRIFQNGINGIGSIYWYGLHYGDLCIGQRLLATASNTDNIYLGTRKYYPYFCSHQDQTDYATFPLYHPQPGAGLTALAHIWTEDIATLIAAVLPILVASVSISPASIILAKGQETQTFVAMAKDADGIALPVQPAFAWSVDAPAISNQGVLNVPDFLLVRAKASGVTGTAAATLPLIPDVPYVDKYLRGPLNAEFQYGDETCGVGDVFGVVLRLTDGEGQPVALAPGTPVLVTVSANGQVLTQDAPASIEHGPSGLVHYELQATETETAGRKQITVTIGGPGNRQSFGPCGLNVKAA